MIIFLYGPDDYRREQKKKFYIEEFKKKHSGLGIGCFDFSEEGALGDFVGFARGQSIFEEKKLAVIENLDEADAGAAAKALKPLVDKKATIHDVINRTIVLCSSKNKPPKQLSFLLDKPARTESFECLAGRQWVDFIKEEAKRLGARVDDSCMKFLAEVYSGNTWGLVTELERISNLGRAATRKDLESFGLDIAPNYWVVMNNLRGARLGGRLWALEKLLSQNEPPPKIFNILSSLWREKIPRMAEYDFMVKSGKLEYEEALLELIL